MGKNITIQKMPEKNVRMPLIIIRFIVKKGKIKLLSNKINEDK